MENNKELLVDKNITIRTALQVLESTAKKILFVIEDGRLIGALSDGDVRRWILKNGSLDESIALAMNPYPLSVMGDKKSAAFQLMKDRDVSAIPCVNENKEVINVYLGKEQRHPKANLGAKVVIMAGGKGERLMPYTSILPKPLMPIGEKPIIEWIIERFHEYGCNDFTLTINYKKNMIKAYFDDLERNYVIHYVEEDKPLGTGGSLYFLRDQVDDSFFVSNCDILIEADFGEIFHTHKAERNAITVVTASKEYVIPYGIISLGEAGEVTGLREKPVNNYLVNTGIYVIEPYVLDYLKPHTFTHITDLINTCLSSGQRVGKYLISDEALLDMGQFENMEQMKQSLGV